VNQRDRDSAASLDSGVNEHEDVSEDDLNYRKSASDFQAE
jgi:hypothetical protein